jgi:hypothetical protein
MLHRKKKGKQKTIETLPEAQVTSAAALTRESEYMFSDSLSYMK